MTSEKEIRYKIKKENTRERMLEAAKHAEKRKSRRK